MSKRTTVMGLFPYSISLYCPRRNDRFRPVSLRSFSSWIPVAAAVSNGKVRPTSAIQVLHKRHGVRKQSYPPDPDGRRLISQLVFPMSTPTARRGFLITIKTGERKLTCVLRRQPPQLHGVRVVSAITRLTVLLEAKLIKRPKCHPRLLLRSCLH
jgi:hypothetical protein